MTVAEFAAWLLEQPDQGATVQVIHAFYDGGGYALDFDSEAHAKYQDYRDEQYKWMADEFYGQRYLILGVET